MALLLWLALPLAFIALVIGLSVGGKSITVGLNGVPALKNCFFCMCVCGTGEYVRNREIVCSKNYALNEYIIFETKTSNPICPICVCTLTKWLPELSECNMYQTVARLCVCVWLVHQTEVHLFIYSTSTPSSIQHNVCACRKSVSVFLTRLPDGGSFVADG